MHSQHEAKDQVDNRAHNPKCLQQSSSKLFVEYVAETRYRALQTGKAKQFGQFGQAYKACESCCFAAVSTCRAAVLTLHSQVKILYQRCTTCKIRYEP